MTQDSQAQRHVADYFTTLQTHSILWQIPFIIFGHVPSRDSNSENFWVHPVCMCVCVKFINTLKLCYRSVINILKSGSLKLLKVVNFVQILILLFF